MRLGSLCSGAGGLDMAVEAVFGAETAWHCELDPAASKVLAHRWPGVPNHGDLTTMGDAWGWVEPVDIMCAGWPCQPFSIAGKRKGADDERAIWPYVADAIRLVRPRIVVLENVAAVLAREFGRVANSLAALGYDMRWTCLSAAEVGAPHRRERLFVVAYADESGPQGAQPARRRQLSSWRADADTTSNRRHEGRSESAGLIRGLDAAVGGAQDGLDLLSTPQARDSKGVPKDDYNTHCLPRDIVDCETSWGKYETAIRRWEAITRPAPVPTIPGAAGLRRPRLNPAFSEWLMGWPPGWVTDVPELKRNDQLRIIGNGVVPQQAVAALSWLLSLEAVA